VAAGAPVELDRLLRRHDLFDDSRNTRQDVRRSIEGDVEVEHDPSLVHAAQVSQLALQQIGIADDHLLAVDAANARRLEADVLDHADNGIDRDRVADVERLVEDDGERGEDVAEDVLHRERERDAADAQSRDQRRDGETEHGLQRRESDHDPQDDFGAHAHGRDHRDARAIVRRRAVCEVVLHPEADRGRAPHRGLPQDDEFRDGLEVRRRARAHRELRESDEKRDDEKHPRSRLSNQLDDHVVDLIRRARRERSESRHEDASHE